MPDWCILHSRVAKDVFSVDNSLVYSTPGPPRAVSPYTAYLNAMRRGRGLAL